MAKENNQITNSGVPNRSGLEVYMTVTIDSQQFLMPIVMTDSFGNAHTVLRRKLIEKIED